jgi:hypothetical protein
MGLTRNPRVTPFDLIFSLPGRGGRQPVHEAAKLENVALLFFCKNEASCFKSQLLLMSRSGDRRGRIHAMKIEIGNWINFRAAAVLPKKSWESAVRRRRQISQTATLRTK